MKYSDRDILYLTKVIPDYDTVPRFKFKEEDPDPDPDPDPDNLAADIKDVSDQSDTFLWLITFDALKYIVAYHMPKIRAQYVLSKLGEFEPG
jgi:hypothetical protein